MEIKARKMKQHYLNRPFDFLNWCYLSICTAAQQWQKRKKILTSLMLMISLITGVSSSLAGSLDRDPIKKMIIAEAQKSVYVTPAIALAVAETESAFRPDAISHKGAIGVMQIMPRTARLEFGISRQALFDARTNIRLGVKFLDDLTHMYKGRIHFALSHYNGGSAVGAWPNSKVLPYTRDYVNRVLDRAQKYQRLLDQKQPDIYLAQSSQSEQRHSGIGAEHMQARPIAQNLNETEFWLEMISQMRNNHKKDNNVALSGLTARMQNNRNSFQKWLHQK
jgi:hypothetical protein